MHLLLSRWWLGNTLAVEQPAVPRHWDRDHAPCPSAPLFVALGNAPTSSTKLALPLLLLSVHLQLHTLHLRQQFRGLLASDLLHGGRSTEAS